MNLNKLNRYSLYLYSIVLLSSCFVDNDEIMTLPPREPGDPQLFIMETSLYSTQSYFNMVTNQTTASNDKVIWDLNFECNNDGWHILINPATKARAAFAGTNFDAVTNLSGLTTESWKWDRSCGEPDSTALYAILDFSKSYPQLTNNVYIIDRGYNSLGNRLGYKKIMLVGLEENRYEIRFADLNGENDQTSIIEKNPDLNFISFSFNNGGETIELEPEKNDWQILFSQYTGFTPDDFNNYVPYFVQGVLINRNSVQAVVNTTYYFNEIDYDLAQTFTYSSQMDTIGHLWKVVTINMETMESNYVCDTSRNHIIKTNMGEYYKLRFLNFYNGDGIKGYTSFEYQKL